MSKANFTEGSINKYLFSLSMPALITILVGMSFITVDTYFLSILGQKPLTAISFIFPVVSIFQMIGVGLGIAASSVLSRLIGAAKCEEVSINIATLILLALAITIICTPIIAVGTKPLFYAMGASAAIMPYIQSFMYVWLIGLFFLLLGYMGSNILRANGKAKLSANMQIGSSLVNLALSPLFIFPLHWGIAGSAFAGVVARLLMIIVMYRYIFNNYLPHAKEYFTKSIKSFWAEAKKPCAIAIPAVLTNVIGPLSALWMVHILARIGGGETVAGFGIAARIEMLAVIPLYALSASVGPIIGQNMGANIYNRCYSTLIKSYQICLIWGALIAIILLFIGHLLAHIFTKDANIIHVTTIYLGILPCSYASWGIIMMTNANFNAMGKPVISTIITLVRLVVVFMPLSYVLALKFGYLGAFAAFAISNVLTSIWAAFKGISEWRKLNEKQDNLPAAAIASTGN
jgi:putative MATE family efflux protein